MHKEIKNEVISEKCYLFKFTGGFFDYHKEQNLNNEDLKARTKLTIYSYGRKAYQKKYIVRDYLYEMWNISMGKICNKRDYNLWNIREKHLKCNSFWNKREYYVHYPYD